MKRMIFILAILVLMILACVKPISCETFEIQVGGEVYERQMPETKEELQSLVKSLANLYTALNKTFDSMINDTNSELSSGVTLIEALKGVVESSQNTISEAQTNVDSASSAVNNIETIIEKIVYVTEKTPKLGLGGITSISSNDLSVSPSVFWQIDKSIRLTVSPGIQFVDSLIIPQISISFNYGIW